MRRGKPDGNARELDCVLAGYGAKYLKLDALGDDAPDRLIGYWGVDQLVEYKNPEGRDTVSNGQAEFYRNWRGRPVQVVRTAAELEAVLDHMRPGSP